MIAISPKELADRLRARIREVVFGQDEAVDFLLTALLAEGHVLLEGVPGTAKTLLAQTFARSLDLEFRRVQFTPDLMPADLSGTRLFDFNSREFHFTKGPIFTEVLLADELNRTPPKTQAALLEAMQERGITLDGETHSLGPGFFVVATQNPIEMEGTYPLPEAQLDRFLFRVLVGYPGGDAERRMVAIHGTRSPSEKPPALSAEPLCDLETLVTVRRAVGEVHLGDPLIDYIVRLVEATRDHPAVACGASPRAATMLAVAARARAALDGEDYVVPDLVQVLAAPALAHRLVLEPAAEIEGRDAVMIVEEIVQGLPVPR